MIAAPPPPAVSVDRACYYRTDARSHSADTITVTATGLAASSPYSVRVGSEELRRAAGAPATTDSTGALVVRVASPHQGLTERSVRLTVTAGSAPAATTTRVTAFDALLRPPQGDPRRAVRVRLLGWPQSTVYLHYLAPRTHQVRRTIRVGRTTGACGHATVRLRHLYPFDPHAGGWRLRFDTHRAYHAKRAYFVEILSRVSLL